MPPWAGVALRRVREGRGAPILLVLLLLVAAMLRWNNLNWDQGHVFHPDERHILMVTSGLALPFPLDWSLLLSPNSPLNPKSFAYGSLPFYLLKLVAHVLASLGQWLPFLESLRTYSDFDHLRLVGRFLSGLFDLGSIALIYAIGCRLRDRRVGLLAAAFLTLTVINVQYSHFYASDTLLTFFVLAGVLFSIDVFKKDGLQPAVWAGIAIGMAVGSKFSAAPVLAVLVGAHLLRLFVAQGDERTAGWRALRLRMPQEGDLNRGVGRLLGSLLAVAVMFVIVEPYAVIDSTTFWRNIVEQNNMVRGIADLPYTRQYANTPAYWYFVWNLMIWGMGLPMGLIVLAGSLGGVIKTMLRPRAIELLIVAWLVPYFAITGSFHAKFLRYLLPLTPFLCLYAAYALFGLRDWVGRRKGVGDLARSVDGDMLVPAPQETAQSFDGDLVLAEQGEGAIEVAPPHPGRAPQSGTPLRSAEPSAPTSVGLSTVTAGSWLTGWLGQGAAERAVSVAMAVAIVGGLLYALAFSNIYASSHTAVRASEWIYQNVPKGARLMTEHWEEGMPVGTKVGGTLFDPGRMGYKMLSFEGYQPDNPQKFTHITQRLAEADYIIFFSNRLYDTIPRLPERYPITTKYYQLLFGEQLGFRLEAYATAYPSILGLTMVEDTFGDPRLPVPALLSSFQPTPLTIVAGKADESFSVYDHPKVLVFKKVEKLSEAQLRTLFGEALTTPAREPGGAPRVGPSNAKSLILSEAQRAVVAAGGTFRDLFDREGIENRLPIPIWLVMVELLGLLGLPLAFPVFRNLPDRGYLLAKALGILALVWLNWMMVSLGLLENTRLTTVLALLLLALISGFLAHRQWPALRAFWVTRRRQIVIWETVFWVAFGFFLIIRLANPDLWHPARGGEKPMDIAYLMAAIKSASFPPYDPWFAGGYLNYYYYGQVIVGTLIRLSGIVPTTAYNLAVPLLFALTAGGAFSAAYNLLAGRHGGGRMVAWRGRGNSEDGLVGEGDGGGQASRHRPGLTPALQTELANADTGLQWQMAVDGEALGPAADGSGEKAPLAAADQETGQVRIGTTGGGVERGPLLVGIGAAVAAVLFGNLGGAFQLMDQIMRLGPPPLRSSLPVVEGLATLVAGLWRILVQHQPLVINTDWYWGSTRVLEGTINEFPFFTFLYADLHAHLIALPFTLLALGLAINLVKGYARRPVAAMSGGSGKDDRESEGPLGESTDRTLAGHDCHPAEVQEAAETTMPERIGQQTVGAGGSEWTTAGDKPPAEAGINAPGSGRDKCPRYGPGGWAGDPSDAASNGGGEAESQAADEKPRLTKDDGGTTIADRLRGALRGRSGPSLTPWLVLEILVTGLVIGALMPINSWDFPTYVALYGMALLVGWYVSRPLSLWGLVGVAAKAVGVLALSYALYWPFHSNFQQWYTGVEQIKEKSDIWGYLRIHGLFLFAIASFLVVETGRRYGHTALFRVAGLWLRYWEQLPHVMALQGRLTRRRDAGGTVAIYAALATLALMLIVHLMGMTLIALMLGLLVWTAFLALHRDNSPEMVFVYVMVATGLALSAAVDVIAIKGDVGRMNTVFKFYLQVWILWSIAGAVGVYFAGRHILSRWPRRGKQLWGALLVLLIMFASVYPLIASRARVSDRFNTTIPMTLDGTAYMATATFREENPETKQGRDVPLGTDLPAMRWMQDNISGTPVILEAWASLYRWGARYSIYTGLPTVIGWDWHQKQQRWGYQVEIDRRLADVRTIYNDPNADRASSLLDKYEVQYIIVGELERALYTNQGLAKFDRMVGQSLEVVYDNQGVKIYRRL